MESIRLRPDYFCYPLWWNSGERVGDIDPATLPLSQPLIDDLLAWADAFDAVYNEADPAESGFRSIKAVEQFDAEGVRLWKQLQEELASSYHVVYKRMKDGVIVDS